MYVFFLLKTMFTLPTGFLFLKLKTDIIDHTSCQCGKAFFSPPGYKNVLAAITGLRLETSY